MNIKRIIAGIMAICVIGAVMPSVDMAVNNVVITASAKGETAEYTEGTYEQLTYRNYGDRIEISDCDTTATEVIIPSEIEGLPVIVIGEYAFSDCRNLTSVIIPGSVESIENYAFMGCMGLTSIKIPDSVTDIGTGTFSYCVNLTSIEISDSLISIGNRAFFDTPWFKAKREENPLVIVSRIVIDGETCSGDVVIPDGTISIGIGGFEGCSDLTSVTIPNSVTSIGYQAFNACSGLTSITILNSECEIYDNTDTISNGYDNSYNEYYNGTICGYDNSTAQVYAEKYGYKFESLGEAPTKELAAGDIDGSGIIDATDASFVLAEYAVLSTSSTGTFTEAMKKSADVNGDGKVDSVDSSAILGYYAYTSTGGTDTIEKYLETSDI